MCLEVSITIKSTPVDEADSWREVEVKELCINGVRAWTKLYLNLSYAISERFILV